jgi:enoyl-CoA hydratase/carnithine racemase
MLAPFLAGASQPPLKPVIGAIRGRCLDLGLLAVGACTSIRIAGASASFGLSDLIGTGAVVRSLLRQQVARTTTMWLASGGVLDASAALRSCLVTEVVDDDQVLSRADEVARLIAGIAPRAIRIEMTALQCTRGLPQPQVAATCQLFSTLGRFDPSTLAGLVDFFKQRA